MGCEFEENIFIIAILDSLQCIVVKLQYTKG